MEPQEIRETLLSSGFSEQQSAGLTAILSRLATKDDLAELRADMRIAMNELEGRLRQEFNDRMNRLEQDLNDRMNRLERDLTDRMNALETRILSYISGFWWKLILIMLAQAGFIVSAIKLI